MEIRRGNSSAGDLVTWMHRFELNDTSGFYIRLRMSCAMGNGFTASFLWMRPSQTDGRCKQSDGRKIKQLVLAMGITKQHP